MEKEGWRLFNRGTRQFLGFLMLFGFLLIGITFVVKGSYHGHYLYEGGTFTDISFFNLACAGTLAILIHRNRVERPPGWDLRSPAAFWFFLGLGFFFLAVDEVVFIHERLDLFIHELIGKKETDVSDSLDDLIVGVYLLAGLGLLWYYRQELGQYSHMSRPVGLALVLIVAMIVLDLITSQRPYLGDIDHVWWIAAEELCKLGAQYVILGILLEVHHRKVWHK